MFAEKPLLSTSHPSNIHLPPINKNHRRRLRPPATPSYPSAAIKAAHIAENVSALKAKYADYTTWLKTSTQDSREPLLTQELLKNSLCGMGINVVQAEQLVTKCSWYVYQFQKNLKIDSHEKHQVLAIENHEPRKSKTKLDKIITIKDTNEDSTTALTSLVKDDSSSSNSLPRLSNKHIILPTINFPTLTTSSRPRRVDFGYKQVKNSMYDSRSLLHPQSKSVKRRTLRKLQPLSTESLNSQKLFSNDSDSSSQKSLIQQSMPVGNLRSILRKQASSSPSVTSTEISSQKIRSRALTPLSTVIDEMPLGTRSRRLFGGSEFFAQIMNELEQQKKNV